MTGQLRMWSISGPHRLCQRPHGIPYRTTTLKLPIQVSRNELIVWVLSECNGLLLLVFRPRYLEHVAVFVDKRREIEELANGQGVPVAADHWND